jgi:hypothetical protein
MKTTKTQSPSAPSHVAFAVRHAFLGRRILNELRILMRLAAAPNGEGSRALRLFERDPVSF